MRKGLNMRSFFVFYFILFIFIPVGLFAGSSKKTVGLNLQKTVSMALDSSEDYKIKLNQLEYSRQKYRENRAKALPSLDGEASWSNNFEYPDIAAAASTKDYAFDSSLNFEQLLFSFGKINSLIKSSRKNIDVSDYQRQNVKESIIYEAKLAYYNLWLANRRLQIARDSYKNAKQNKEILKERTVSGRASRFDNIKTSADIASRKPAVSNALSDYNSAEETLKVTVGLSGEVSIELTEGISDDYPQLKRKELVESLYKNQPIIKAYKELIKVNEYLVASKRASFYPEISAFGSWSHKGSSNDSDIGESNLEDYGVAGLKVDLPIWTSGEVSSQLAQAKIDKSNAELEYKKVKEDYLLALDKALNQYRGYLKTLKANREAVSLARESFNLSQELFQSGKISVTDLNDAELNLTNEKAKEAVTLFNLNTTLAEIERLTLAGGSK